MCFKVQNIKAAPLRACPDVIPAVYRSMIAISWLAYFLLHIKCSFWENSYLSNLPFLLRNPLCLKPPAFPTSFVCANYWFSPSRAVFSSAHLSPVGRGTPSVNIHVDIQMLIPRHLLCTSGGGSTWAPPVHARYTVGRKIPELLVPRGLARLIVTSTP